MNDRAAKSPVEYELGQESAHTLGLTAMRMQRALAVLAALPAESGERLKALDDAAAAAHAYVIQREVLGFRDTEGALRIHGVPAEVRGRMGTRRRTR